ncbi:MAG: hypothetical protein PVF85_08455, partial [Anaerolineales bacterium]
ETHSRMTLWVTYPIISWAYRRMIPGDDRLNAHRVKGDGVASVVPLARHICPNATPSFPLDSSLRPW